MVERAAALFDAGQRCGKEANMAKMLASEASWAAAEACLQTHGGFGFAEAYDVERKYRETRLYQVAPISHNLIIAFLAAQVLGKPRSSSTPEHEAGNQRSTPIGLLAYSHSSKELRDG